MLSNEKMEPDSGHFHTARTIKKIMRHRVIRDIFKTDEFTSHKDFMSSECQHIKGLNNLKDVSVPAVSKVLTVKQDIGKFQNNKVRRFIFRIVTIPLLCEIK
jgi:hypothetical protein